MSEPCLAAMLPNRAVLRVAGADARTFLQAIVSNDVERVAPERAIWTALLTPQGKYLHDFFVCQKGADLLLECEAARRDDLLKRLKRYTLRADVTLTLADDLAVAALFGGDVAGRLGLSPLPGAAQPVSGGLAYCDPRLLEIGVRVIAPEPVLGNLVAEAGASESSAETYDTRRLELGLPDGSRDMVVERSTLQEGNFDLLNGVDFDKGCYMGQEVTARTHHRGLVKRRLVPVHVSGPVPPHGTPVLNDDREVGDIRSGTGHRALASLRCDAVGLPGLSAGGAPVTVAPTYWLVPAMALPEDQAVASSP